MAASDPVPAEEAAAAIVESITTDDWRTAVIVVVGVLGSGSPSRRQSVERSLQETRLEILQASPGQRGSARLTAVGALTGLIRSAVSEGAVEDHDLLRLRTRLRSASRGIAGLDVAGALSGPWDDGPRGYAESGRPPGTSFGDDDDDDSSSA